MSNKLKVGNVPCDYCLWLARVVKAGDKKYKIDPNGKLMRKARTTFGISFNKTVEYMKKLGYLPKIKSYECKYFESMGMGSRNPKTLYPALKGKKKHVHF